MAIQTEVQHPFLPATETNGVTAVQQQISNTFMNPALREYMNQYQVYQDHAPGIEEVTAQINATYNRGGKEFYTQPIEATQRQAPPARVERKAERVA